MKWNFKALLQQIISMLPHSSEVNFFFQYRIAKNLPAGKDTFLTKVNDALIHVRAFNNHFPLKELSQSSFYEFGTGWDMIIPLTYYAAGVRKQTIIDLHKNVHLELVNDTISRFNHYRSEIENMWGKQLLLPDVVIDSTSDLEKYFNITYLAPRDARATGFASSSFDCITSTDTMEHIPVKDLRKILNECHRLLKSDGGIFCIIGLEDHYSYFDKKISPYNFLQFSDFVWSFVNPAIHYQNRLRASDYIAMAKELSFNVIETRLDNADEENKQVLSKLPLAQRFSEYYSFDDLGVKHMLLVLKKENEIVFPKITFN